MSGNLNTKGSQGSHEVHVAPELPHSNHPASGEFSWSSRIEALFARANVVRITPGSDAAADLHTATPEPILRSAVTFLGERKPVNIVVTGAAQGESALYFSSRFPGSRVIGIEKDPKMVTDSRAVLKAAEDSGLVQPGRVTFAKGDFVANGDFFLVNADLIYFYAGTLQEVGGFAATLARCVQPSAPVLEAGFKSQLRQPLASACSEVERKFHEVADPNHRFIRYFEII